MLLIGTGKGEARAPRCCHRRRARVPVYGRGRRGLLAGVGLGGVVVVARGVGPHADAAVAEADQRLGRSHRMGLGIGATTPEDPDEEELLDPEALPDEELELPVELLPVEAAPLLLDDAELEAVAVELSVPEEDVEAEEETVEVEEVAVALVELDDGDPVLLEALEEPAVEEALAPLEVALEFDEAVDPVDVPVEEVAVAVEEALADAELEAT